MRCRMLRSSFWKSRRRRSANRLWRQSNREFTGGAIGAIRELISQLWRPFQIRPDIFVTGGASMHVADLLKTQGAVRHVPNLVLSGIALVKA